MYSIEFGIYMINPFIFIKNKHRVMSSEGFSVLKKCCHMFSARNAAQPVGCDSPLQIILTVWRTLKQNLSLVGWVWHPSANYNGWLARKKGCQMAITTVSAAGCHTQPDTSAEQFALKAVKAICGLISLLILDLGFFKNQCHH
jgi:hypothetical protein